MKQLPGAAQALLKGRCYIPTKSALISFAGETGWHGWHKGLRVAPSR